MASGVTLKGFDSVYRNLKKVMPDLNVEVAKVLRKYGNKMVKYARTNHTFKTQTGQLERSITAKVDSKRWELIFFIDEVRVYSNGYNYGVIQNDGFGQGYSRGKISPALGTRVSSKGLKADDFMGRAWEKYVDDMTAELQRTLIRVLG
jgi:hypothetical protein